MRENGEDGQAVLLLLVAMSIFLIGAAGLAVDGAHLYSQRQMAQSAADGAALAGIMSVYDGTNTAGAHAFSSTLGSSFTCGTSDAKTPCVFAAKNGFGTTASDTVTVDFPNPPATAAPGVTFSTSDPTTLIRVNVSRNVNTTLMALLGSTVTTVNATAMAAIVNVFSPVPILVMHPTLSSALSLQGNPAITICGGPGRSIQVNSGSATAAHFGGSASVDLSHAGPNDPGNCTSGTGADFGVWGGPTSKPGAISVGAGHYVEPASPILDPLANVAPPAVPVNSGNMGTYTALANGVSGCPVSPGKPCRLYYPGLYATGIDGKNSTPVFKPGIYYIQGNGMSCAANCDMYMATGFTDTGAGTTGTGWTGNVLFYNTGTGTFQLTANGTIYLQGSPANSAYDGILFFQDRTSAAASHSLGGGGAMTLLGTLYFTNTKATMLGAPSHYQSVTIGGGSGSGTLIQGEIIVDTLTMGGNGGIEMNLNPSASVIVRQVALVN